MWRCANDIFGFCSGKPQWAEQPKVVEFSPVNNPDGSTTTQRVVHNELPPEPAPNISLIGGKCSLDKKTCGFYLTNAQQYEHLHAPADSKFKIASAPQDETKKKAKRKPARALQGGFDI